MVIVQVLHESIKTHRGIFLVNNYKLKFTLIQHIFSNIKVCAGQIRREEQTMREKKINTPFIFFITKKKKGICDEY